MPSVTIPKDHSWKPQHYDQFSGDIVDEFGISLTKSAGYVAASGRLIPHTTKADQASLIVPSGYAGIAGTHMLVADKVYMTTDIAAAKFAPDGLTGVPTPTTDADIAVGAINGSYNTSFFVTTGTSGGFASVYARRFNSANWVTVGGSSLGASSDASARFFLAAFGRTVYASQGYSTIAQVVFNADGTATMTSSYIVLPFSKMTIRWMKAVGDKLMVGCMQSYFGGDFTVYEIDPYNLQQRKIEVPCVDASPLVHGTDFYLVESTGIISQYDGIRFTEVARFPGANGSGSKINLPHRNGHCSLGRRLNILMPQTFPYIKGGVWAFEPESRKLYHSVSPQQSEAAQADYGTSAVTQAGFLAAANPYASTDSSGAFLRGNGELLCGLALKSSHTESVTGIFSTGRTTAPLASYAKRCYITTPRIANDSSIDTVWRRAIAKYMAGSYPEGHGTGSIRISYRTDEESFAQPASQDSCTWVDASTYTTAAAQLAGVSAGDEVFVTNGQCAGCISHIASIAGTTTKTVVLTDPMPIVPSGTFNVQYSNFRKIDPLFSTAARSWDSADVPDTAVSDWIQYRAEIVGDWALESLQTDFRPNLRFEE